MVRRAADCVRVGLYSGVYDYEGLEAIDAVTPTVIVDTSGNGAVQSRTWLRLERLAGVDGLHTAYRRVLGGEISPDRGVIVDLQGSG